MFGIDDALIGSIIGGIGSAVGGLGGGGKKGPTQGDWDMWQATNDWTDSRLRWAYEREDNALQRRKADAQAAGIHPLAALGMPTGGGTIGASGGMSSGGQSTRSNALGGALSAVGSILGSKADRADAKELRELEKEKIRADIRSQDAYAASQLATATQHSIQTTGDNYIRHAPFNHKVTVNKNRTAAKDISSEYGDLTGSGLGFLGYLEDLISSAVTDTANEPVTGYYLGKKK